MLIAIGLLLTACAHQFSGVAPNPIGPAPDFALTDENGQPFNLSDLRGKWILLAYGYTHCPDVCPLTLSHLRDVKKSSTRTAIRCRWSSSRSIQSATLPTSCGSMWATSINSSLRNSKG